MSISDIRTAIQHEDSATPKFTDFKALEIQHNKFRLQLTLQARPSHGNAPMELDENLIGAAAWWRTGTIDSSAKVRQVFPESNMVVLDNFKGPLPHLNQNIRLTPTNYLWALKKCWEEDAWAARAFSCMNDFKSPRHTHGIPLTSDNIAKLRPAQRQTFDLVNMDPAFIWGPPGTGKTTVLGELLGAYLQANPYARVLVLCTTNRAVDEAIISVDNALAAAGQFGLRYSIKRIGPDYDKVKFEKRPHLLPGYSGDALTQECQANPVVRLKGLTITSAIIKLKTLSTEPLWDLLVIDEASQVSLAHTLAVMPLGKIRLFAGDPIQLSPVSKASSSCAKRWIGQSAFAHKPSTGPSICLLSEQSRMAEPICDLVSSVFYNGELRVAEDALNDRNWLERRNIKFADIPRSQHVSIRPIATNATRSPGSRKFSRMESVELTLSLIRKALADGHVFQKDIVVLTAFRKQANIIHGRLRADRLRDILVDTVHSLQGGQAPVVIFDPVDGLHDLLMHEKGRQLINVALSRAQAKLILMLSDRDIQNPTFSQINEICNNHANRPICPIAQVLDDPMYLTSAIGQRVHINGQVADITRFSSNGMIMWADMEETGMEAMFDPRMFV